MRKKVMMGELRAARWRPGLYLPGVGEVMIARQVVGFVMVGRLQVRLGEGCLVFYTPDGTVVNVRGAREMAG